MFGGIDQASLDLIIELQLQEVQALVKGKHRQVDMPPDSDSALKIYTAELESLSTLASDRRMCQSIAQAVMTDGDLIAEHIALEEQALLDHQLAVAYSTQTEKQGRSESVPPLDIDELLRRYEILFNTNQDSSMSAIDFDDELLSKYELLFNGDRNSNVSENEGESSSWGASRDKHHHSVVNRSPAVLRRNCMACEDSFHFVNVARCPCGHEYCRGCLTQLFQTAIDDESLYPPRCCGRPIPIGVNQLFLSPELVDSFLDKELDYRTSNRTYCYKPACSTLVRPQFIQGDTATCNKCKSETCTKCKGPAHGEDCPNDPATQEILRIADEEGWQRCRSCRRLVELNLGCNHIICRCGAQFCYVCGAEWKSCSCPQAHVDRLLR